VAITVRAAEATPLQVADVPANDTELAPLLAITPNGDGNGNGNSRGNGQRTRARVVTSCSKL